MRLGPLVRLMRPRQWPKNAVIFAAVVFDRKLLDFGHGYFWTTLVGFVLFCLLSSAVYIINDMVDVEADRQHPTKRLRPLASGAVSMRAAGIAAALLLLVALAGGFLLNLPGGPFVLCEPCSQGTGAGDGPIGHFAFGLVLGAYLLLQLLYNFVLKHQVILDVLAIASGFVLRVGAGVALIPVQRFSPWLYVCMTLLGLFVGFGKRRHELTLLGAEAGSHRKILENYNLALLDEMMGVVTASTVIAYSLYTFSAEGLPENHAMMLTIPFVLYGVFRYLYLIHVRGEGGAPEELVLRDRGLQVDIGLWGLTAILILYTA